MSSQQPLSRVGPGGLRSSHKQAWVMVPVASGLGRRHRYHLVTSAALGV